jgi:hypothetical protein
LPESVIRLREACRSAAARLSATSPDWLAVAPAALGKAPEETRVLEAATCGSFRGHGVDVRVRLRDGHEDEPVELPLPALVAGWLRERAGARSVRVELIDRQAGIEACRRVARRLDDEPGEHALLVLGDGSTRHGIDPPGGTDERAPSFDGAIADALARADAGALRGVPVPLAAELGAWGRAPWQVLACLAERGHWRGELLYSEAPFGVAYHVAVWERE